MHNQSSLKSAQTKKMQALTQEHIDELVSFKAGSKLFWISFAVYFGFVSVAAAVLSGIAYLISDSGLISAGTAGATLMGGAVWFDKFLARFKEMAKSEASAKSEELIEKALGDPAAFMANLTEEQKAQVEKEVPMNREMRRKLAKMQKKSVKK